LATDTETAPVEPPGVKVEVGTGGRADALPEILAALGEHRVHVHTVVPGHPSKPGVNLWLAVETPPRFDP
jgi:hypothetical protein